VQSEADQLEIKIKDWLIANDKAGNTQSSSTTRGLMVHLMSPGSSPSRIDHPIGAARRVRTTQVPTRENPPTEARTLTTQVVSVHWTNQEQSDGNRKRGMSQLSATQTHVPCACNYADVDTTLLMCCITVGNSPSYHAATLFDTGAHTSLVNRELAAWIEQQAKGDTKYAGRRRMGPQAAITQVSLAGTSQTSAVLGNVVFDLTFLNEVTQLHETLRNIHAQVIVASR
jgi:hypothetical protein